jgi:CubicO group peptidase (beta-lactamase class C family)
MEPIRRKAVTSFHSDTQARETNAAKLREGMQQYVESGELPGLVYLIDHPGGTELQCLGHRALGGTPMTPDTIFRIASMSKPIVAVATLMLAEQGQVALDQPIEAILPELNHLRVLRSIESELYDTVPLKRSITVEDLLTFRAGTGIVLAMPGTYPIQTAMEERKLGIGPPNPSVPPEPDEWIRRFAELPLIHQPGEGWMYVTSSEILGVLIARLAKTPLPDLLHQRVFEPLGMRDTGFFVPENKIDRFATEYIANAQSGDLDVFDPPIGGQWNTPPDFPSAGGGLVSTIDDYAAFARMLLRNGVHGDTRLLNRSSVETMTSNHLTVQQRESGQLILGKGNGWGYGLSVRVETTDQPGEPGSYGWNGGLGTTWLNDPHRNLIAILLTQVHWTSADYPASSMEFLKAAYEIADQECIRERSPVENSHCRSST